MSSRKVRKLMDTSPWIKWSDQKPTESDFSTIRAVEFYQTNRLPVQIIRWTVYELDGCPSCEGNGSYYWRPVPIPEPPPKEPTQNEKDSAAFRSWLNGMRATDAIESGTIPSAVVDAWYAAIAYERAEIRKLIDGCKFNDMRARVAAWDLAGDHSQHGP